MTVIVKHNKTNSITDWTQAQLDEQIALGNFPPGTTLANIVLPSDWNNDHTLTGVGTMAEQDATAVAITGGTATLTSVTTPSVTATTTNLNLYPASTGNVIVNQSSGGAFGLTLAQDINTPTNSTRLFLQSSGGVSSIVNLGGNQVSFRTAATIGTSSGTEQARVSHTTSAVNYVQVTGGATSNSPVISAQGSDAAVALSFTSKSTNAIRFLSNNAANLQFRIVGTNTAVNNLAVTGTIATNAPSLSSEGTDTNISMAFQPKGTGAIDLAAGSRGVNISNGGTVTAITRTAAGSGYTTIPSVAISAPTTAGGVQATASVTAMTVNSVTIANGGTGYTVGNVLTVSGGTIAPSQLATQVTVSTVSSGVITAVTISQFGTYSVLPTNPASVTGGTGTGATFNFAYAISGASTNFTITNAGSGYIEQPTVTFSGGGGSGAAAYATVGSGTTFRTIGNTISFNTPAGESFRIQDAGTSTSNYILAGTGATPFITAQGTNTALALSSNGTGNVWLRTNGAGTNQMAIAHTASAVNYVQVTGSATTGFPVMSSQGSDTNVSLGFYSKGTGGFSFRTGTGANRAVEITDVASSVNRLQLKGAITGAAPTVFVDGTDTNIDLALTPKGTGLVRFGTYVAGVLLATGYINIKAADGTTYKVLVST
jgi:hypothetical protein